MLSTLMGSKNIEKILYFLLINEKCYGTQLHRLLNTPLTPIQKGLIKLEKAGVVKSFYEGKTRLYRFNPIYPLKTELEQFLRKAYELLSPHEKRKYYIAEGSSSRSTPLNFKQAQDSLLLCWNRLKAVKMLLINAKLHAETSIQRGKGDVEVVEEGPSVILFQESGAWQMENGKEIQFSNTLRWTLDLSSGTIGLEHLRFGVAKPVFLFHLKPKTESLLASIDSHFCGSDAYFGQVQLGPHFLQFSWRIVGPKKNDRIECLYSF
jgi:DNA-binding transcriptional ArsR family regulator